MKTSRSKVYDEEAAMQDLESRPAVTQNKLPLSAKILLTLSSVILIFVVTATILFILDDKLSKFPQFEVESVSVSPFNFSAFQQTGDWEINFVVRNPNKKLSISYTAITAYLFYRGRLYSQTGVPAFHQEKKHRNQLSEKRFQAKFSVPEDGYMASDRSSGLLEFEVSMSVLAKLKPRLKQEHWIAVFCNNLEVHFLSTLRPGRSSYQGFKHCTVEKQPTFVP